MSIPENHPAIRTAIAKGLIPADAAPVPEAKPALVAASFLAPGTWTIPVHVVSGDNARGMRSKIGRAGHERNATFRVLARNLRDLARFADAAQAGLPVVCRFTRIGRLMDSDGLAGACKYVRDAVAAMLGVGDGPRGPVRWEYEQESASACGVRIELVIQGARC